MTYYELNKKDQWRLIEYYKLVLRYGLKRHRDEKTIKAKDKLMDWMIKRDFTIHMLPEDVFRKIQLQEIGYSMEAPL